MKKLLKRGFTLIELLVVISIIGILVAAATAGYTNAQKKGRDARRRSDMKAIQSSMEQYYSTNTATPYTYTTTLSSAINPVPTEPKSGWTAYTTSGANISTSAYCICARLEETGKGNATSASGTTTCAWGAGDYFCVQNQQ